MSTVTIISIRSKAPEIGRYENVQYDVSVPAGETSSRTLQFAFAATNHDQRPMARQACSTSVGDIMVLDGTHYLVDSDDFRTLTEQESEAIQKLTSRDTSFGYDFMVENGILKLS